MTRTLYSSPSRHRSHRTGMGVLAFGVMSDVRCPLDGRFSATWYDRHFGEIRPHSDWRVSMLARTTRFVRRTAWMAASVAITAMSAHAQVAGVVNTGQGQTGGSADNAWKYVAGGTGGQAAGNAAVVVSDGNLFGSWNFRDATAGTNTNRGWISSNDAVNTTAPIGLNTVQLFVNLTGYNLSTVDLGGTFWADDCSSGVFVNGTALSGFGQVCGGNAWTTGQMFTIDQASGLQQGMNQLDFVYNKTDGSFDGARVDFTTNQGQLGTQSSAPEPSSMALLGTGLVGLVPMIRRRRNSRG